jgi:hypothetical protein
VTVFWVATIISDNGPEYQREHYFSNVLPGAAHGSSSRVANNSGRKNLSCSHAQQRDLIDPTLLAAVAQGRRSGIGGALMDERSKAKLATLLTRHLIERLTLPKETRT